MPSHRENFDHFEGPIVSKPFDGLDPATVFEIVHSRYIPNDPPGVHSVNNLAFYDGILLSVHFSTNKWSTVEGSAVMVAPGVALASTHVIEPLMSHIMASELAISCTGCTSSGPRHWHVRHVAFVPKTDIVILSMEYVSSLPEDRRFAQSVITTRLPALGETVMIAGLRASGAHAQLENNAYFAVNDGSLRYGVELLIGVGEVTHYHLGGRGSGLPGPLIEVACSTKGGLSGGPAFDKNGKLVGILSSSLDHPDERGPSQVSLLWPALTPEITPAFMPNLFPGSVSLLGMDRNLCEIDRPDVVQETREAGTDERRLIVTHWIE